MFRRNRNRSARVAGASSRVVASRQAIASRCATAIKMGLV